MLPKSFFISSIACLLFSLVLSFDDDEFIGDTPSTLILEHSFDQGINPVFTKRATININSISSGVAQIRPDGPGLSNDQINKLRAASLNDGIYRVRVRSKTDDSVYVSSFLKACSLLESELTDIITVNVDNQGTLLGVSIRVPQPHCVAREIDDEDLEAFATFVEVVPTSPGPMPDTQSYLEKIEHERIEKQKGGETENKSFFAKYWMYIVPVMVIMLFASNSDAGGGGR